MQCLFNLHLQPTNVLLRVGSPRVCWCWSYYCWSPYRHIWAHRCLNVSKWPRVRGFSGLHIVSENLVTHHFVHRLVKKLTNERRVLGVLTNKRRVLPDPHSELSWSSCCLKNSFWCKNSRLSVTAVQDVGFYDWCEPKLQSFFYSIQNLTFLAKTYNHIIII